jgi:hypothetical protein
MTIKEGKFICDEYGRQVLTHPTFPTLDPAEPKAAKGQYEAIWPSPPDPDWRTCEEVWARVERVKDIEKEIDWIKTHIDNLQGRVSILEITRLEKVETPRQIKKDWVEEELENIKNTTTERICQHCKWGRKNPHNDEKIICHHDPCYNTNARNYWCSRWSEK